MRNYWGPALPQPVNAYNTYAAEYSALVAAREELGIEADPVVPRLLAEIGDVSGLRTLDAGCGEGYLSRILAARGARVTGADVAGNLLALARARDMEGAIIWRLGDLSQPAPDLTGQFDLAASHLVLNDVPDYRGFLRTVAAALKPGGRCVLSLNNPYSFVVRSHIKDYFSGEELVPYRGMAEAGVKVFFFQRTLEEYLDACLEAGLELRRLIDVPTPEAAFKRRSDTLIPPGYQFPFFMILSLRRTDGSKRRSNPMTYEDATEPVRRNPNQPTWPASPTSPLPAQSRQSRLPVSRRPGCGVALAIVGAFIAGAALSALIVSALFTQAPAPVTSSSATGGALTVTVTDTFLNKALNDQTLNASGAGGYLTHVQTHIETSGQLTIAGTLQGVPFASGQTAVIALAPSVSQGKLLITPISGSVGGFALPALVLNPIASSVNQQLTQANAIPLGGGQQLTAQGITFTNGAMTISYA